MLFGIDYGNDIELALIQQGSAVQLNSVVNCRSVVNETGTT